MIKKINKNIYEIPKEEGMNVKGIIYASSKIIEDIKKDKTIEQIKNVASLPGIIGKSIALADAHQGYGFSIGGVAAFDLEKGIISPGGVGYDINCSVRLLRTNIKKKEFISKQKEVANVLKKKIPSGVGRGSPFQISYKELDKLLKGGSQYLVEKGYGKKEDYLHTEEEGKLKNANPLKVSARAKKRGIGQVGTLGAGNHFLDVLVVDKIFDNAAAKAYGISKNQIVIMIHCGSRGLGHQVASDYIKLMEEKYGFENLRDRELINAPIKSKLGKDYLSAMNCAANFAFANKQMLTHFTREAIREIFPNSELDVIYDICHNIAKIEKHKVGKAIKEVCVHRKGATRSLGPGRIEVPTKYRKIGQPVMIPGSMGTSSYLMKGTKKSEELSFSSTVHGAGRVMSRSRAIRELNYSKIKKDIQNKKIEICSGSKRGFIEEAPEVYKEIDEVVESMDYLGLSKKVARMKPIIVIQG
ncbi:RtcB family protein [archaeon]|jgi:tRNA-splicing ligase RtcB (3'-phosphate/5'-hydroxy nucleic acid ligase)|nr:RtcB family protein [archaeon]